MRARNVYNVKAVEAFVETLAGETESEAIRTWLRHTVRRWILRHHNRYDRIARDPATGCLVRTDFAAADRIGSRRSTDPAPIWLVDAVDRGDCVVILRLGARLRRRISRVVRYLVAIERRVGCETFDRLGFPDAERAALAWARRRYERRLEAAARAGEIDVYRADDGATIVQLTNSESLQVEGRRMNHCVALYADEVLGGQSRIFSLRTASRRPRATVEVGRLGDVTELRGFANRPVPADCRPALRGFFEINGFGLGEYDCPVPALADEVAWSCGDIEDAILSPEGRALLRDHLYLDGSVRPISEGARLVAELAVQASSFTYAGLRTLFHTLCAGGPGVRLSAFGTIYAYDEKLTILRVDVPLLLLNLIRCNVFDESELREDARQALSRIESALVALGLSRQDCLLHLGAANPSLPQFLENYQLWGGPIDVVRSSAFDVEPIRARRHLRVRQRLNAAKRRACGRRAHPSDAHLAARRLLSGETGAYVM